VRETTGNLNPAEALSSIIRWWRGARFFSSTTARLRNRTAEHRDDRSFRA